MRKLLVLFLAGIAAIASAQKGMPGDLAAARDNVVSLISRQQFSQLPPLVGSRGIRIYYLFPERSRSFTATSFAKTLRSSQRFTWLPSMQGDGGMRPAVKLTLREVLQEAARTKWTKPVKLSYNQSPQVTYRTLFIEDLKRKHPGTYFVDLMKADPTISETSEFSAALILGFARDKATNRLKLTVLGLDGWKD